MLLSERLQTFVALGDFLRSADAQPELAQIAQQANYKNNWFTLENSLNALQAIANEFLVADKLSAWVNQYIDIPGEEPIKTPRAVGVVMAGNIPAVGFHDMLCVLASGHKLMAKLSSQDFVLIHYLIQKLKEINPAFTELIVEADRLNAAEAYIATGSNNTARYFEYYFAKKPHIIRKNRTSVGLLMGEEGEEEFLKLSHDISDYYGLGCRNVSTILVPDGYDFTPFLRTLEPQVSIYLNNHKYQNNYDYNKSIYLINAIPHLDNGYLLLTENDGLVSPISVLYFQTYQTQADVTAWLANHADQIQVVASAKGWYPSSVAFGSTQRPSLADYADGIDTMAFLKKL
ncbi:acyl-CoA reductase [Spirosoma radiotolerans]|uniref:Acyl-CoA reductase n=1 Tax=Spirosoma radiotolerans TaxID=1379870 RepID=A0A0E3V7X6_9BACT|nr:acyl-CoA reductase [Spirosoma radiotolerans]AKD56257.1 acyl-CoA reductase [Spirosoma radiotolerans]